MRVGHGGGGRAVAYDVQTLFTIQTPRLRLTWSARPPSRSGASPLTVASLGADPVQLDADAEAVWLEEETTSLVLVQSLCEEAVTLVHRDPVVTASLASADGGRVLHGPVRTGSQAGRMSFEVWLGSKPAVAFEIGVLPVKVSASEVESMRGDVERFAAGLSASALRPTTVEFTAEAGETAPPFWFAALREATDALTEAVREINRRPALDTARIVTTQPAGQIRRPSSETRRVASRVGVEGARLPARPPRLTVDTPAHRWLAARVDDVTDHLERLVREEGARRPTRRRSTLIRDLSLHRDRLRALRSAGVLADGLGRAPEIPPLVLRRAPAYAQAFEALQSLDRGVALRDGALDVSMQDLAVLYETWSTLAVVRSVADVLGCPMPERPFGIDTVGTDVRLRRGHLHAVRLAAGRTEVEVVYSPRFPAPPALLAQRPDLLLTARTGGEVRRVVLDAKYRRDDSAGYRRRHGAAGPPEDALGVLHRYRDAIVQGPPIRQAVALFPGVPDAAFLRSRLWTSLADLGVGAIPLVPGAEEALSTFIAGLVG